MITIISMIMIIILGGGRGKRGHLGGPDGAAPTGEGRGAKPEKWAPKGGAPKGGAPQGGRPKISRFFSLSRHNFLSFFSLSGGLLVEFWWCLKRWGPEMFTFGLLGLSIIYIKKTRFASRQQARANTRAGVRVCCLETARIPRASPAKSAAEGWGPSTPPSIQPTTKKTSAQIAPLGTEDPSATDRWMLPPHLCTPLSGVGGRVSQSTNAD